MSSNTTADTILAPLNQDAFILLLQGKRDESMFHVPPEYSDPATFLIGLLYDARPDLKWRFGRFGLDELKKIIAEREPSTDYLVRLLKALAACPLQDQAVAGDQAVDCIAHVLRQPQYRGKPSSQLDCHREALFALAAHSNSRKFGPGLIRTICDDLENPSYVVAGFCAILACDHSRAIHRLHQVIGVMTKGGRPRSLLVKAATDRLSGDLRNISALMRLYRTLSTIGDRNEQPMFDFLVQNKVRAELDVLERERKLPHLPRRALVGIVTSDKMNKTRRVEIQRLVKHPQYGKYIKRRTVCYVHDELNQAHTGDVVEIVEARPLSKLKRWRLLRILTKAPVKQLPSSALPSES